MALPSFSPAAEIQVSSARHDKIDLSIQLGSIHLPDIPGRNHSEVRRFRNCVSTHFQGPAKQENATIAINSRNRSRLFGRDRDAPEVVIKARKDIGPGALFSGKLKLSFSRSPTSEDVYLDFQGSLNVARYMRHQQASFFQEGENRFANAEAMRDSLFRRTNKLEDRRRDEFSFDGNDNWIPDAGRFDSFTRHWNERLREYVEAVQLTLEMEIRRVCDWAIAAGFPVEWQPDATAAWLRRRDHTLHSLQRVETYWEFKHPSPLQMVKTLEAELRAYCTSEVVTRYFRGMKRRGDELVLGKEKNCCFLDAEVAPGIRLVIYAKTNQRIRFEVRHFLSGAHDRRELPQSSREVAQTCERIAEISADAAGVLNRFFAFLRARVEPAPFSLSPLELLFRCVECAETAIHGDIVVKMLLAHDSVSRVPALTNTIRAMVRAHILQRVNNEQDIASEAFVVTPQYRQALEALRRLDAEQPITGITRRRRIRTPQS